MIEKIYNFKKRGIGIESESIQTVRDQKVWKQVRDRVQ